MNNLYCNRCENIHYNHDCHLVSYLWNGCKCDCHWDKSNSTTDVKVGIEL